MKERQLITKTNLFPRCEYYARFAGTTAFDMDNPEFWATYHRSQSTRYFSLVGGRKNTMFLSPCITKPEDSHSFFSHTGGILSPFSNLFYKNAIKLSQLAPSNTENVRDKLLQYRRQISELVVQSFENASGNNVQKIREKGKGKGCRIVERPIVFHENNFPGVLIMLPILNPLLFTNEATKYWAKHPKPFQKLLLASFVAILNLKAMKANIPIEIVIRASFGHNLPSVCETENTFRINVGIIPQAYAKIMGEALHELNQMIEQITDEFSLSTPFDKKFLSSVKKYNEEKLKMAINSNQRYKSLEETKSYKNISKSVKNYKALYKAKEKLDSKHKSRKGDATVVPVKLKNKNVWEVIRETGDSMGKSVLAECFRKNETVEWFVNAVMDALNNEVDQPIEAALYQLLSCINYTETVTMNYTKIHSDLKREKWTFSDLSFTRFYESDPEFSEITRILFEGFLQDRPDERLYEQMERAGSYFFTTYKGSEIVTEEADYGSDSEISEEGTALLYEDEHFIFTQKCHLSHEKLRLCGGMKAILLAHYGALIYLRKNGNNRAYSLDVEQMYYEVKDALKMVHSEKIKHLFLNKIRSQSNNAILHYDLNHCNAVNAADNRSLLEKLAQVKPSVVVLDYTSSTHEEIIMALKECLILEQVNLVMLVDSGLKNSQAGQDFNPYGEVRLCARNSETINKIMEEIKLGLSEKDKLTPQAHEMVRACKRRRIAVSMKENFKIAPDEILNEGQAQDYSRKIGTISPEKMEAFNDFGNAGKLIKVNDVLPTHYQCLKTKDLFSGTCHNIHPSGKIIIGYSDGRLKIWDKTLEKCLKNFEGHTDYINEVVTLLNDNILSASDDGTLKEWNVVTGDCVKTYTVDAGQVVNHLACLPNGNIIGSTKKSLLMWNSISGDFIDEFEFDSNDINCIAVQPNGNLIISFSDNSENNPLEEWDPTSWECNIEYERDPDDSVSCITILPNGNILSARDTAIKEWDSTGNWLRTFAGHNDSVTSLLILPNNKLLSGAQDNTLKVWDLTTGKCIETLRGHKDPIIWIAALPNGSFISASQDLTLKVWKTTNNLELKLNEPDPLAGLISNKKTSTGSSSVFFKPTKIINQYPKFSIKEDKQYLKNYLIAYLSKGDLESVKKLERKGASFLDSNKEGIYPLPAAVSSINIEALRYLESKLPPDEAAKQWQMVVVNKVKKNIKQIKTKLKEYKNSDEFGTWYTLCTKYLHEYNDDYHQCLSEMTHQKKIFIENCNNWCIDISGIRDTLAEYFEDNDPVGRIEINGFYQTLTVHEYVINAIFNQLSKFENEIELKANKCMEINPGEEFKYNFSFS